MFIMGLLMLVMKMDRFIFVIIGLELMISGAIFYNMSIMSEAEFIVVLVFSVFSSVMSLLVMVDLLGSYGNDHVMF